jgi:serine/threonine protein kinase
LVKNIETKPLALSLTLSADTRDFLTRCLKVEESERMSWDEVFLHPIFKGCFQQYAEQNQHFEDKLKRVMGELRFQINAKNLDLNRLLEGLGFKGYQ